MLKTRKRNRLSSNFFFYLGLGVILNSCWSNTNEKCIEQAFSDSANILQTKKLICDDKTTVTEFYPNKNVRTTYLIVNDKKEGSAFSYYENGHLNKKLTYKNDSLNGQFETYSQQGILIECGIYKNNLFNGQYDEFYESGRIKVIYQTFNGETWIYGEFEENGTIKSPNPFFKIIKDNNTFKIIFFQLSSAIAPIIKFGEINKEGIQENVSSTIKASSDTPIMQSHESGIFYCKFYDSASNDTLDLSAPIIY